MKTYKSMIFVGLILTACATVTPVPPKPDLFKGSAGLMPEVGQASVFFGDNIAPGDMFAEVPVNHTRTGKLLSDVKYSATGGSVFGALIKGSTTLEAGTELYAMTFNVQGYNPHQDLAWCAPSRVKLIGIDVGDAPVCMFWHNDTHSKYIQGQTGQSTFYAPELKAQNFSFGTIPSIEEVTIDFGSELSFRAYYHDTDSKDFDLKIKFWDGQKEYDVKRLEVERQDDGTGTFELWGESFKILTGDSGNKNSVIISRLPTTF